MAAGIAAGAGGGPTRSTRLLPARYRPSAGLVGLAGIAIPGRLQGIKAVSAKTRPTSN